MVNRLRKLMPKRFQLDQPGASAIAHVTQTPQPQAQRGSWLSSSLAIAILLSSAGCIAVMAWLSVIFIFNPEKITWVNQLLPEWAKISLGNGEQNQTLQQIKVSLSQRRLIAGKSLFLEKNQDNSFLLPVFQQRPNCQSNCQVLVELRIYQRSTDLDLQSQGEKYYRLVTQLSVSGLDESFVLAAVNDLASAHQETDNLLPLNEIQPLEGQSSTPGVWFYVSGKQQQATKAIAYGYIIYYNPERDTLQQMLSWKSLSGQVPKWQQVTGGGNPELVIDQTIGIEPQLQIYQVQSVNLFLKPIQLEEITLQTAALKDSAYQDALLIARSGLWTPAWEWLQSLQKQRKAGFPPAAQAQMDMIRLHSQLTKAQAEKSWASPGQEVLADLIDGRWQKALQVFTASPSNVPEITALLKADQGRLWKRTQAALQVNPNRQDVQAWAALILAVQHDQGRANSWLQAQPKIAPETLANIQGLLALLDPQTPTVANLSSRIVGSIQPITQINNTEWLQPDPQAQLQLADNEVWYQMQVSAFDDGKGWQSYPFEKLQLAANPGKSLWDTLGLSSDSSLQIVTWLPNGEQQVTSATIKAVQLRDGELRLLATGSKIANYQNYDSQPRPLALTNAALEWVQPSAITLGELSQKYPETVQKILPKVWGALQQSGQISDTNLPEWQQLQTILSDWPVQLIDLTNDGEPEVVITISAEAIASLTPTASSTQQSDKVLSRPRTLIFGDSGSIIYTDFQKNSQQSLTAIAKLADNNSLALLVENIDKYSLQRWSKRRQRFE